VQPYPDWRDRFRRACGRAPGRARSELCRSRNPERCAIRGESMQVVACSFPGRSAMRCSESARLISGPRALLLRRGQDAWREGDEVPWRVVGKNACGARWACERIRERFVVCRTRLVELRAHGEGRRILLKPGSWQPSRGSLQGSAAIRRAASQRLTHKGTGAKRRPAVLRTSAPAENTAKAARLVRGVASGVV